MGTDVKATESSGEETNTVFQLEKSQSYHITTMTTLFTQLKNILNMDIELS